MYNKGGGIPYMLYIHMWLGCGYKLKKKFIMIERYLNPNVNISNIDTCISKICKKTPYKYYTIC